jgi:hypothetical protein
MPRTVNVALTASHENWAYQSDSRYLGGNTDFSCRGGV